MTTPQKTSRRKPSRFVIQAILDQESFDWLTALAAKEQRSVAAQLRVLIHLAQQGEAMAALLDKQAPKEVRKTR